LPLYIGFNEIAGEATPARREIEHIIRKPVLRASTPDARPLASINDHEHRNDSYNTHAWRGVSTRDRQDRRPAAPTFESELSVATSADAVDGPKSSLKPELHLTLGTHISKVLKLLTSAPPSERTTRTLIPEISAYHAGMVEALL
jgi:hypothetical protein